MQGEIFQTLESVAAVDGDPSVGASDSSFSSRKSKLGIRALNKKNLMATLIGGHHKRLTVGRRVEASTSLSTTP